MKILLEHSSKFIMIVTFLFTVVFFGCTEEIVDPGSGSDKEAMLKIADEDSSLRSFEVSYNEEAAMDLDQSIRADLNVFKVGHRLNPISRVLDLNIVGDTAFGLLTKTYEGVLFIAASYDPLAITPDTIIRKPFTSIMTRNLIFVRVGKSQNPSNNWKLAAISFPEGGTPLPRNVDITKLTIFLANGDTFSLTSPNSYFLSRGKGWWREIPLINKHSDVTMQIEVTSAYADTDFVSLTFGGNGVGMYRTKKKFDLISSVQVGNLYNKVYERTFTTHQWPGHFHAVINAFPRHVIFDDATPVEIETWGFPYIIKR